MSESKWISVKEKLPERGTRVNVKTANNHYFYCDVLMTRTGLRFFVFSEIEVIPTHWKEVRLYEDND